MRPSWLALAGLLCTAALAAAQQPPQGQAPPAGSRPPVAPPPAVTLDPRNPLDAHLMRWEKEMKAVQTLVVQAQRTEKNKVFGYTDKYVGEAKYMKLPVGSSGQTENLASLYMRKEGQPTQFEHFICTGTHLYQFLPQQKEIRVYQLPPPKQGQVGDDSFLSFLFGMKAEEAKRRYELKLVKEDQYYIYVEILPRLPQDKADFARARLVLNKDSFLPRQLWFEQANGDEVTWDLPRVQSGVQLDRKEFVAPQPPQGWKLVQPPRTSPDVPPRVIRQNQP
jgi:TIGR03009 family protein